MDSHQLKDQISPEDFLRADIRVGSVLSAVPLEGARKPAYRLEIDFGPIGILNSSAQITINYSPEELIGRQVIAVVNFPARMIAGFKSDCLVLGVVQEGAGVVLLTPDRPVPDGLRIA